MRFKNYHKILCSENSITEPTGIKNWKNNFPDYFPNWGKSFRLYINPQRIITTKMEPFKFRLVENEPCTLCLLPESIEHIFLDCTVTTAFYLKAILSFNHENDTDITLSSKQVTFSDIPRLTHLTDYPRRRLHLFVGRVTVDLFRRSWVRFPPRSKDFFFTSCGSLIPFTRANAQWVIHGFN